MKKILISVLMIFMVFCLFADDAIVLPAGVLRATFANSLISADSEFDADSEVQDMDNPILFDNFGAALEFGITDTVSAAIQWAPGVMLYTDIEDNDKVTFPGMADLFVGAKIQALNKNSMRFAIAPGIAVPLDSYDAIEQGENYVAGDDYSGGSQSTTESFGLGGRIYFDYQITEDFFINLYNQTIFYLPNEKYTASDVGVYATVYGTRLFLGDTEAQAKTAAEAATVKSEYEYPLYMDFEVEAHYDLNLTPKTKFGFGFPVKYSYHGEITVEDTEVEDSDEFSLSINPSVSFFTAESIPFEVVASYDLPLYGMNSTKTGIFTVKLKLFYDFY